MIVRPCCRTCSWLVAVALTTTAILAHAQTPLVPDTTRDSTARRQLTPVVVTATRTARRAGDLAVSTSVMTAADVQSTPAQTLDDVLRTVPGVNMPFESAVVAHPTSDFSAMRGIPGISALVLLDGIPLNDPFFGYVQWAKVPMEMVDHIEVVRGANSSLFGTYALGGVINIITRTPTSDGATLEASYGTNATRRFNVLASQQLTNGVRLSVNGSYFDTDGYLRPVPDQVGPIDRHAWGRAANLFARLDLAPRASPWNAAVTTNLYDFRNNQGSPNAFDGQHAWDLNGTVTRRLGTGGSIKAGVFFEADGAWTDNTDPITALGQDEFVSNVHETPATVLGASAQWSQLIAPARSVITAGADARQVAGEDRADVFAAPDSFAFREIGGGTQQTFGLFAQEEWFATRALAITASLRLDAWRNINSHHDRAPGTAEQFPDKASTRLNPRLAARYKLPGGLALRGSFYEAFNAPNLDQLYRPYSADSYANVPNSQLGPETLIGGEVGVEWTTARSSLQANAFRNTLNNVITYNAIAFTPVYTTMPVNLGQSRSQGIEVFGDWQPVRDWHVGGAYTYTESIITENPADTTQVGKNNPDAPRHQILGDLGYTRGDWASVWLRGRYLSSRYTDASNTLRVSPFFVLDGSASVTVYRGWTAFVEVENLLNRLYVVSEYGFDARGTPRQVFVGARAHVNWGTK